MDIREKYNISDDEYYKCIGDLIESEIVRKMDKFIQHGSTTTLKHCLSVSYLSYRLAKELGLDYVSVARAGLLHDFYLYDWHDTKIGEKFFDKHGFVHPIIALENAQKYFELNKLEKDIIKKHMWPLTLTLIPKYKESVLVSAVDKYISTQETIQPYYKKIINFMSA